MLTPGNPKYAILIHEMRLVVFGQYSTDAIVYQEGRIAYLQKLLDM